MKAKIKKIIKDIELPQYQTKESAAFDIQAGEDVVIAPGKIERVRTGLIIEAPEGFFLAIIARGSTAAKTGVKMANGVGVIDRDYAGPNDEIFLPLHNFTDHEVTIHKGDRIAQGIFLRVDQVAWEEVAEMRLVDRGGYGSTGGYKEK